jgi:hypothetical protein
MSDDILQPDDLLAHIESLCDDAGASAAHTEQLLRSFRELAKRPEPIEPYPLVGKTERVELDPYVTACTAPVFAELKAANDAGKSGMVLAHVFRGHMRVFFVPDRIALELQRLTASHVGATTETRETMGDAA